jgi:nicotinate-nucleotide adenylyltransferase
VGRDYKNLSAEELRDVAVRLLKPQRVNHVLGCAETAVKLARLNGADETVALRAGLLHDITKAIDGEDQLLLVDKYDILISDFERKYPKLLHAKTGAAVAKYVFGESPAVVEAIYWHTTGKADMSLMEKIVYLADYMEPNRSFPGVEPLRELAFRDLDRGLLMGFDMCIEELIREKKPLCTDSAAARDFLRAQLATQTTL